MRREVIVLAGAENLGPYLMRKHHCLDDGLNDASRFALAGNPGPETIGIDEISIRDGHTYPIM
jgi:hypothetical protein